MDKTDTSEDVLLIQKSDSALVIGHKYLDNEYVIYPTFADKSHAVFYLPSFIECNTASLKGLISILLDDERIYGVNEFEINEDTVFTYHNVEYQIKHLENRCIYLDVETRSLAEIKANKENKTNNARIKVFDEEGYALLDTNELELKCRGNTTFYADKKSYGITLNEEIDIGFGKEDKYRLISNVNDISKIRNKVAYTTAKEVGLIAPACDSYNLFINGEYQGFYLLTTNVEVENQDAEKVNKSQKTLITEENTDENLTELNTIKYYKENTKESDNSVYLLELDYNVDNKREGFTLFHYIPLYIENSTDLSKDEVVELARIFTEFQESLSKDDESYLDYIDIDSWAMKYLLEEILMNYDANCSSAYYYVKKGEEKIYSSPCWDYDKTLLEGSTANDLRCYYAWSSMGQSNYWYSMLSKKDSFMERVLEIFEERYMPIVDDFVSTGIDKLKDDYLNDVMADSIANNSYLTEEKYISEVENYKNRLMEHCEFLHEYLLNRDDYIMVIFACHDVELFIPKHYMIKKGTSFNDSETIPLRLPDAVSYKGYRDIDYWVDENIEEFDFSQQLYEDTVVYAHKSFWSTLSYD